MNKKNITFVYVINIVFQAIFTLLMFIGGGVLVAWLSVSYLHAPSWIYVPLILVGVALGFISMIRFVLTAMKSLENLERQHERDEREKRRKAREKKDKG